MTSNDRWDSWRWRDSGASEHAPLDDGPFDDGPYGDAPHDDAETSPRRRSGWLLVAAALPWIVVGLVLVAPERTDDEAVAVQPVETAVPPTNAPDAAEEGTTAETGVAADITSESGPESEPRGSAEIGSPEIEPPDTRLRDEQLAASVALAVARSQLTGLEPHLDIDGLDGAADDRYAEHLMVESVERLGDDAMVVTVLAVVLEGSDELEAGLLRLGVPIVVDEHGPHPGGEPWPLAVPHLEGREIAATAPVDDPALHEAALEALRHTELTEVDLLGLWDTGSGLLVAEVTGRMRDDAAEVTTRPWLRSDGEGLVVIGAAPERTVPTHGTQPDPEPDPDPDETSQQSTEDDG